MHIIQQPRNSTCESARPESGGLHASTGGSPCPALRRVAAAPGAGDGATFAEVTPLVSDRTEFARMVQNGDGDLHSTLAKAS